MAPASSSRQPPEEANSDIDEPEPYVSSPTHGKSKPASQGPMFTLDDISPDNWLERFQKFHA